MATKYRGPGDVMDWTNLSSVGESSDAVVNINGSLGVCKVDIGAGATGSVSITGKWDLPKATGFAASQGDKLVWDANAENFVAESSSLNTGDVSGAVICLKAAGSAATTVEVLLLPGQGTTAA